MSLSALYQAACLFLFLLTALAFSSEELLEASSIESIFAENRLIVEFETSIADVQDEFASQNLQFSVHNEFDSPIFLGMSIQIQDSNVYSLDEIQAFSSVKNVWQASYVTLEFEAKSAKNLEWDPHQLTGVDTLHSESVFGDGINIAVIDSGLDKNHEAFKNKNIDGLDFTKDAKNPTPNFEDKVGHGTFVSSIICGDSQEMTGVAPRALIKMYKVFGDEGRTTDDVILAALLRAFYDSPDIISLSLGSDRGYPSMPISKVASKISEVIPIVFAAGNSGRKGPYRASSGASGKGVLAVASVESVRHVTWTASIRSTNGHEMTFQYIGNKGSMIESDEEFRIDIIGNVCHIPGPAANKKGYILMGIRGTCKEDDILSGLTSSGYSGGIMFVSPSEMHTLNFNTHSSDIILGLATNQVRTWIKKEIANGEELTLKFIRDRKHSSMDKTDGSSGQINQYSSWGPTFDQDFYPHIAAPGGNVFGAKLGGGYLVSSGTSFACPYIAGIIALYLSEFGRVDPQVIRKKVIGAGKLLNQAHTTGYIDYSKTKVDSNNLAPLLQQGNGLIDVSLMWNTKTAVLSEPFLLLNDTGHRISKHEILFVNDSPGEVTYTFQYRGLQTVYTADSKKQYVSTYWPEMLDLMLIVKFSESQLSLKAHQEGSVSVEIILPQFLDSLRSPISQGTIQIVGSNGDSVSIPFIGSEFEAQGWTPFGEAPILLVRNSAGMRKIDENDVFDPRQMSDLSMFYNVRSGTALYSIDLVEKNYDMTKYRFPPCSGKDGFFGSIRGSTQNGNSLVFPVPYAPISSSISYFQLQGFADRTNFPPGEYRLLCRALKIFGNPENKEDWQLFLTDSFTVGRISSSPSRGRILKGRHIGSDLPRGNLDKTQKWIHAEIHEVTNDALYSMVGPKIY